jgi:membrane-bound ClpP family serine protease
MIARPFLILPLILTISLASCADNGQAPVAAVAGVLSKGTPAARRAEVTRLIRAACPTQLTNDELEWAAQFVEENRTKGAVWLSGRLWKMNAETRICRGQ